MLWVAGRICHNPLCCCSPALNECGCVGTVPAFLRISIDNLTCYAFTPGGEPDEPGCGQEVEGPYDLPPLEVDPEVFPNICAWDEAIFVPCTDDFNGGRGHYAQRHLEPCHARADRVHRSQRG